MNKIFICDTSSLLKGYTMINDIANKQKLSLKIPKIVLDELDRIKDQKEHKENKNAHKILNNLNHKDIIKYKIDSKDGNNDDKIIACAKYLANTSNNIESKNIFIISEDKTFKIKYPNTLDIYEFIAKYENYSDNIPNENTKKAFKAIEKNDKITLKKLLDSNIKINAYDSDGFTLLIRAIKHKKIAFVESILSCENVDINKRDNSFLKITPLGHAVQQDSLNIVNILLQNGAKAYIGSKGRNKGNTPFLMACYDNRPNAIKILNALILCDISINQIDANGYSGLIKSAIKGHENITKWLLEKGIDTKLRDFNDKSALDYAIENNFTNIISLIKNQGK